MRIVITGASGFVGQSLVPLLARPGVQLLLVGRDPAKLAVLFPQCETCGYDDLAQRARGWDLLVHLAVANTDAKLDSPDFMRVNVDFAVEIAGKARQAGIGSLINVSSTHALDHANQGAYAASKRQAAQQLASMDGLNLTTIYLPAVYGDRWSGRLRRLNRLPRWLANGVFGVLAMLQPTVNVRRLADFILSAELPAAGTELILSDDQQDNAWFVVSKRVIDVAVAIGVFAALWWAMALIWAIIRLQSPGPGIFAQERVGRNGREFVCYKFRTMKLGTRQAGTHEVSAAAITPFGRFLRSTKLDELPQAWNILRNEMSLVGPRPCLPTQTALVEARHRLGVLNVKPGITGLAQINGIDMSDPDRLAKWDARYLALQSLRLDISIGLSTLFGMGRGDKVAQ
jgi:lipopolysaccharide/colanic/teichoic acid biosynthesis glycosyltransferase/uncharacterized protein YbjT (DUF2867 family)